MTEIRSRRKPLAGLAPGYTAAAAVALVLGMLTAWSAFAVVQTTVTAPGQVVPVGLDRQAQYLEGGVVQAILVKEGEQVSRGQVLVRISPAQARAELGQKEARIEGLRARIARLSAEASGAAATGAADVPASVMLPEKTAFAADRAALSARIRAYDSEALRETSDAASKRAQMKALSSQEAAVLESVRIQQAAMASGGGSRARLAEAQAQLAAVRAQEAALPDAVAADEAAAVEARARADAEEQGAKADAAGKLARARSDLAALEQEAASAEDRLSRTEVRSPVHGIIQKLYVNDVGEVVPPNSTVADIVPTGGGLVVEAKVRPEDIRGLRPGLRALLRLSAYDVSRYGTLDGRVTALSPDTAKDPRTGQVYYLVRIRTAGSEIHGEPVRIGMQATVSIVTGSRTVLHYLTAPISDWSGQVFRER